MSTRTLIEQLGIEGYLEHYRSKDLLRVLTCGSVDDGKSTLIGRMLYDSGGVAVDQIAALERDSANFGEADEIDYSLLLDGLQAEREQGITIDVAYRYFSTDKRKFIIADTPGHVQYTRNMATGASTADLAVILVDARKGVLDQTRRHAFIASLLGIKHVVVAVNKMDLVDYSEEVFEKIRAEIVGFCSKLQVTDLHFIPVSAKVGDNVARRSENIAWYQGGPLLDYLETVNIASDRNLIDLRFPIQYVIRPDLDFRGYAGTVSSGIVRCGDQVVALPSGKRSRIRTIQHWEGEVQEAFAAMAVTLTLEDEIDISRGDVLVHPNNAPRVTAEPEAMIVWMGETPLEPGISYSIKQASVEVPAVVRDLRYRIDVHTMHREPAETLGLNEIGRIGLSTSRPLAIDAYRKNRSMGAFILIDRMSNATVGAGMFLDRATVDSTLDPRRVAADAGTNVREGLRRPSLVGATERGKRFGHGAFTIWLTGLPRSGKSSIARGLEKALFESGCSSVVLDGEVLRRGLNSDLGFSVRDRDENMRRGAAVARLLNDQGLIAIAAFVSPLDFHRQRAREAIGEDSFVGVFCDAPQAVCEERDEEELYSRAHRGELKNVSGVDSPFDRPSDDYLALDTDQRSVDENVATILQQLKSRGLID
ncbi:MAG: sulfate adenylyltransferase subunit CysN [bacterium]|nr:sulfate adenylyltransferase subunit CysN [bacterium]